MIFFVYLLSFFVKRAGLPLRGRGRAEQMVDLFNCLIVYFFNHPDCLVIQIIRHLNHSDWMSLE